jgi:hypothetical protein
VGGVFLKIIRVRKEHNITVGGAGINHVLVTSDIICREIESNEMMMVDTIIFEQNQVPGIPTLSKIIRVRKPDIWWLSRNILTSGCHFLRQNCFDAREKVIFEFRNEVLTIN